MGVEVVASYDLETLASNFSILPVTFAQHLFGPFSVCACVYEWGCVGVWVCERERRRGVHAWVYASVE